MLCDTMGNAPPAGAVVLFDGNLDGWTNKEGSAAEWKVSDGAVEVVPSTGDIATVATFEDHYLHLEFRLSDMPEATGQHKSNSGVFLQGRYEIQVLDSSGWERPGEDFFWIGLPFRLTSNGSVLCFLNIRKKIGFPQIAKPISCWTLGAL